MQGKKGFEDIKQIFGSHNSMYNRQYNDQMTHEKGQKKQPTKYKNKKQWGQNTTRKIKD